MERMLSPTAARGLPALPVRALLLAALASLACAAALATLIVPREGAPAARSARGAEAVRSALPAGALGPVSAALGRSAPEYRARVAAGSISTFSAPQRLHASFSRAGVRIGGRAGVSLRLQTLVQGGLARRLAPVTPTASANRVTFARPGLSEWYANGPLGIEQGFTLTARPPTGAGGAVVLAMRLGSAARTQLARGGQALTVRARGGSTLRYGNLLALDATGRALPSRMTLDGRELRIMLDARGARYPLRIDPLVQQGRRLTGAAGSLNRFGYSVALSDDGNTAVVGARYGSGTYVFARSGSAWSLQGTLVTEEEAGEGSACEGEGAEGECSFGRAVAMSADGNTVLIGAATADERRGAAWVFTRAGSVWTQQGPRLTAAVESARGHFGAAVALSGDGSTAVIGGPADQSHRGTAWVFTRGSSGWSERATLTGPGTTEGVYFGRSVAISEDGGTVAIGGTGDSQYAGAVWVFGGAGSTWAQRGAKLTGGGESGEGRFGYSVALSADGSTLLAGGRGDAGGAGAAWVFTRVAPADYAQQGEKLIATGEQGPAQLGYSATLSRSGEEALLGGPRDNEGVGAAWVFRHGEAGWEQQGAKLTGLDTTGKSWFGASVALSADLRTALIGGFHDAAGAGAAWVFRESEAAPGEPPIEEPPEGHTGSTSSGTGTGTGQQTVTVLAGTGVLGATFVAVPAPVLAVSGNLLPLSGKVCVKLPGSKVCVPLTGLRQVPFGTIIDARHGKVTLTTAAPGGGTQSITYYGGMLKIGQSKNGTVTATLVGGSFKGCPTARERSHIAQASARRTSRRHTVRKLWSEGHGSYSTKGNYATGAVLGTRWLTEDRCEGTLIRVVTDKVLVRDLVTHRKHVVKAGHSYLAKAP
jgi:hypothetical protein